MVTSTEQPNILPAEIEPPYVPEEVWIIGRSGQPPLLPKSYEEAKRWLKGRRSLKLGKVFPWTLRRLRDGIGVLHGDLMIEAWLPTDPNYLPPFYGHRG